MLSMGNIDGNIDSICVKYINLDIGKYYRNA